MNPLQARFATVRRRLRFVITFRGVCWLLATLLLTVALAGLLDWRVHLPGLVRAIALAGVLGGAGAIGYRYLIRPLSARTDDLSLALQIEQHYPALNDCLASTVQFLEQPAGSDRSGSPSLRRQAVQRGLHQAQNYDFNQVIDGRGLRTAGLSLILACALAVPLVLLYPGQAFTALIRLANPFGSHEWPPQTRLIITARNRVARGEVFEVRGHLEGVIPEKASVSYRFSGLAPAEQTWTIAPGEAPGTGNLVARLEPERVRRNFEFQVRANDAVTAWQAVSVLPPPALVPLDGRPSPQVRLTPPAYTDLPPFDLPDGAGNIETVLGTSVRLRAATDRPIAQAWIELRPELPVVSLAAFLCPAGTSDLAGALAHLNAASQAAAERIPARLHPDGRQFDVHFRPWIGGAYALRLEDETGLGITRLYDLRIDPDPAPSVNLERPSASLDSLLLLPTAEITVQVLAEDPQFALRSVFLEYRCAKDDPPRRLPLFEHARAGAALGQFSAALGSTPLPLPVQPLRLRLPRLQTVRRLSLTPLKHPDGSALRAGDVVVLQACADDFDNISVDKRPGRSHEIELHIVKRETLEASIDQAQAQIQQELVRVREQQRDALNKVDGAEKQWRATGRLRPEDLDNLVQAEQLQQQIRARVGNKEEGGLRADVAKVLQSLRDNHLPRSGAHERMELAATELDRLAREELEQIEPQLTNARKENELASESRRPERGDRSSLSQALRHQEEVEKTIEQLLAELVPYSTIREIKGQARTLLEEQRQLNRQTEQLSGKVRLGAKTLTPAQDAERKLLAEQQKRQAANADQLLGKMEQLVVDKEKLVEEKKQLAEEKALQAQEKLHAAEKLGDNPEKAGQLREEAQTLREEAESLRRAGEGLQEEVAALRDAREVGIKGDISTKLRAAERSLGQNQFGQAGENQQGGTKELEKMVKALEERREEELDRLIKKMRQAERELAKLADEQERLQKKVKEASAIEDPQKREQELQRLAREQDKLRKRTQELARDLKRLRVERGGHELTRAGGQMDDAGQQLSRDRGDNAQDRQEGALDRLDEARREVQRAREQVEEELAREKLAKIADVIKRLRERQEAAIAESARIHNDVLQRGGWNRSLLGSLSGQSRGQRALSEETASLADQKLTGAVVFVRLMKKGADAMKQAADQMDQRRKAELDREDQGLKFDASAETAADARTQKLQQDALRRLDQVLDAIKLENGVAQRAAQDGNGPMGGGKGGSGDGLPPLAQLKALRALQAEVNERTEEFARKHPDASKLTRQQKTELEAIQKEQVEVAELFDELATPAEREKEKGQNP
jgi:hypothetical protein